MGNVQREFDEACSELTLEDARAASTDCTSHVAVFETNTLPKSKVLSTQPAGSNVRNETSAEQWVHLQNGGRVRFANVFEIRERTLRDYRA